MLYAEREVHPYRPALLPNWKVLPERKGTGSTPRKTPPPTVILESSPECTPNPQYKTRWRGNATFEEILTDKNVQNVAYSKMRSIGYTEQDAEDCFQMGSLNLWQKLKEEPTLLSDKGAAWIGIWIAFSGSRRTLWKHKSRCVALDTDRYGGKRPERWAGFATRIDERIDFELLMNALAQRYDGDPLKLYGNTLI